MHFTELHGSRSRATAFLLFTLLWLSASLFAMQVEQGHPRRIAGKNAPAGETPIPPTGP